MIKQHFSVREFFVNLSLLMKNDLYEVPHAKLTSIDIFSFKLCFMLIFSVNSFFYLYLILFYSVKRKSAGNKTPLSPETAAKIIVYAKENKTQREIVDLMAKEFGVEVNQSTVCRIVSRNDIHGTVKRKPGSGRPRKTTPRVDRTLKRLALSNRKQSFQQLSNSLHLSTGIRLTKPTISSRLKEGNIRSYVCARKPLLSKQNRKKRRHWALNHFNKNLEFWKTIIWSDESRFNLISDRPQRCLRMPHERLHPECLQNTVKFGRGGIMVWGCFSFSGIGRLHWVKDSMNGNVYMDVLENSLFPSIAQLHPDGNYIFQQDNAPCHVSKVVKNWMKEKDMHTMLDWPPQSPDMNPIEHLWDYIGRKIQGEQFTSNQVLWDRIQEVWYSIPIDYLQELVSGMNDRVSELKSSRGGATSY